MKKLFIVALAAFGMVACMNEEITELPAGNEISFDNAFIDNATRAELTLNTLNSFNVWGYIAGLGDANDQSVTLFDGSTVVTKNANGVWQYNDGARYWAPGEMHYFEAVAPVAEGVVDVAATDGKINTIEYNMVDGESDIIYAAREIEAKAAGQDNGAVAFTFNHILSRVMFTFENNFAQADGITLEVRDVKMAVPAKGTYTVNGTESAWSVDTSVAAKELAFVVKEDKLTTDPKFVLPYGDTYTYAINFVVDVKFDGVVINTIEKSSTVMVALAKGNSYNFKAAIDAESLDMETIEFSVDVVKGWGEDAAVDGTNTATISTAEGLMEAFKQSEIDNIILTTDINLNDAVATRAEADPAIVVKRTVTLDLNGKTLSATSAQTGKNYNMIDVRDGGNLTVKNGKMEYEHKGENMGWNNSTNLFNVTAGGVLTLVEVNAQNLGGSDMGFVAHLNNWGEVTLNVENCVLESNYVAVRVFNSGNDMNNVTIKNSTLKGGSNAFWVHNYTIEDFGSQEKVDAHKALLNLDIFNNGNTFLPEMGIRFGFTNSVKSNSEGLTKSVSEDGSVVTLGSVIEGGVIPRYFAGSEENRTVKKVVIEEGVAVLENRCFRKYYALEEVVLPYGLTTIGVAEKGNDDTTGTAMFQGCESLKKITIPETVTVIDRGTFYGCTALESINIPAGVTRIEESSLRATGLVSVEFHEGVTYFGAQAFRDCKQLMEVYINAPQFTIEPNAFGVMAAPYPGTTIYVANAEMKEYLENTLTYGNQYTVVAPEVVTNADKLAEALAAGENVVLAKDLTDVAVSTKAPYGNYYGVALNGGVLDGNGKTLNFSVGEMHNNKLDNYGIMTSGGTIKNVTITGVFRAVMIMDPTEDIIIDNAVIGDEDVCYSINTGEGNGEHSLYVSNSTLYGWNSYGTAIKDVTFTNCTFAQGEYYTNVFGRLTKPYVDTVYENCEFCSLYYIDLSQLGKDGDGNVLNPNTKITLKNCTVNGVKLTTDNWTELVVAEGDCGEGQISIELKDGSYLTADNRVDYVVFE